MKPDQIELITSEIEKAFLIYLSSMNYLNPHCPIQQEAYNNFANLCMTAKLNPLHTALYLYRQKKLKTA